MDKGRFENRKKGNFLNLNEITKEDVIDLYNRKGMVVVIKNGAVLPPTYEGAHEVAYKEK